MESKALFPLSATIIVLAFVTLLVPVDTRAGDWEEEARLARIMLDHRTPLMESRRDACKALGAMDKLSDVGIGALVKGLFFVTPNGEFLLHESIEALTRQGPAAVPWLLDVLRADSGNSSFREVLDFAGKCGVSEYRVRRGPVIPMALSLIVDPRSARPLMEDMIRSFAVPRGLTGAEQQQWTIDQANRLKFELRALSYLPLSYELLRQATRAIRSPEIPIEARLDLALALAYQGTPEASDALLKVISPGTPGEEDGMPSVATHQFFLSIFLAPLVLGLHPHDLERFDSIFGLGSTSPTGEFASEQVQTRLAAPDIKFLLWVNRFCRSNTECWDSLHKGRKVGKGSTAIGLVHMPSAFVRTKVSTKLAILLGALAAPSEDRSHRALHFLQAFRDSFSQEDQDDYRRALLIGVHRMLQGDLNLNSVLESTLTNLDERASELWRRELRALLHRQNYDYERQISEAIEAQVIRCLSTSSNAEHVQVKSVSWRWDGAVTIDGTATSHADVDGVLRQLRICEALVGVRLIKSMATANGTGVNFAFGATPSWR
jgi:hypothetical protein